jgi:LMBR1 domain-containing protein 1
MGILVLLGFYLWITICSRGLASVPLVGFLMETTTEEEKEIEIEKIHQMKIFQELLKENTLEKQATIQTRETILLKYLHTNHQAMSLADQNRIEQLKQREQILNERRQVLLKTTSCNNNSTTSRWWFTIKKTIGICFLFFSLLIVVSIGLTNLHLMNPIDFLLVKSSSFFPMDYFVFGFFFLYFFCVSFMILQRHRIVFIQKKLVPRRTSSSTMTLITIVLIYLSMVGLFSLLTLAPQYTTFGDQKYFDHDKKKWLPCTLFLSKKSPSSCHISQLAQFYTSLTVTFPMLDTLFYIGQWCFAFSFFPWLFHTYSMLKPLPDPDPKAASLLANVT